MSKIMFSCKLGKNRFLALMAYRKMLEMLLHRKTLACCFFQQAAFFQQAVFLASCFFLASCLPVGEIKASIAVAGSRYPAHVVLIREVSGHLVSVLNRSGNCIFQVLTVPAPMLSASSMCTPTWQRQQIMLKNDAQIMCSCEHKPGNK